MLSTISSYRYASGFSPSQPPTTFGNAFELIQDFLRTNDNLHLQLEGARKKESDHEKAPIREAYKYEKLQNELVKAYDELRKTDSKFSIRAALERITYTAIAAHKLGGLWTSDHDLTSEKSSATVTKGLITSKVISTPNDNY